MAVLPSQSIESFEAKKSAVRAAPKSTTKEGKNSTPTAHQTKIKERISKGQKILQANVLKAAQMDDPV